MPIISIMSRRLNRRINFAKKHGGRLYFEFTDNEELRGLFMALDVMHNNSLVLAVTDVEGNNKTKVLPEELCGENNDFPYFNGRTIKTVSQIGLNEVALLFVDDSSVTFFIETTPTETGYSSTINYNIFTAEDNRNIEQQASLIRN